MCSYTQQFPCLNVAETGQVHDFFVGYDNL